MTRFAAIDVGSNAMRMRVVDASAPAEWREIATERVPVRLGRDVFMNGKLAPTAIADAVDALNRFREAMKAHGVDAYRAVATSAVRDAVNGDVLVERASREAGVKLEVIEGVEEARLARVAVTHSVDLGPRRALLIDIGGGSVEITLLAGDHTRASVSLPLGTVRLTEAFLDRDARVTGERRALLQEYVDRLLHEAPFLAKLEVDVVIATGGNAEAIGLLCPTHTPDGPAIDAAAMAALLEEMSALTAKERCERYALRPDRADVIVPAAFVLASINAFARAESIVVPGVGLREGILAELVDRAFSVWDTTGEAAAVESEALNLGRRYQFDETHAQHVAGLASSLFDQLTGLHGLGPEERSWLRLAAILHDVGDFVGYDAHHKHTYYIVAHSELMGLTPVAKEIVANVSRYHRKAFPDLSHLGFRKLDRRGRAAVRKLSAILRLADAFDREHLTKVRVVEVRAERARVTLRARGDGDLALELWTASRKADLFEEVFELECKVEGAAPVHKRHSIPGAPRPT